MNDLGKTLCRWRDVWLNRRVNFEPMWEDSNYYIVPGRREIRTVTNPGNRRTHRLFDSTAVDDVLLASAAAHGAMTPSTFQWFVGRLVGADLRGIEGIDDWEYEVAKAMFEAVNDSNFHSEGQEVWIDLFAMCTGCLYWEEESVALDPTGAFNGLQFTAFQPGTFVITENALGVVNGIIRDFQLSYTAAKQRFGELSPESEKKATNDRTKFDMLNLCHYVGPVTDFPEDTSNKPFVSCYFEPDRKHCLRKRYIDEFPYAVPRWSKATGEEYGRGPGITAMPNIRTLNRVIELLLRNAAKQIDPPLQVLNRSIVGDLSLQPASWNSVKVLGAIAPIPTGGRLDFATLEINDLRQAIHRSFLVDQIQFPPMTGTPATATEIATRMELMRRILGPVYGRVLNEWHTVMLTGIFNLMWSRNALPPPPAQVAEALRSRGPSRVRFSFENSITRSQSLVDVEAVERALTIIVGYQAQFPGLSDAVNDTWLGRFILEALRVPAPGIRNEEEAQGVADARAQANQEITQTERVTTAADALGKVAPLLGEPR